MNQRTYLIPMVVYLWLFIAAGNQFDSGNGGLLAEELVANQHPPATKPNVLLIMADDLGFSDLGCYGGEICTPNLDRLAAGGIRFTQFYNTARCWPTRAALLTGYYAQQVRRDTLPDIKRGNRPEWALLLPDRLKKFGYRSYHSGKWHLDGMPIRSGFDQSYLLKDQGRFFYPQVHWKDDKKLPPIKRSKNPFGDGFYATSAIADHAIRCLKDHQANHSAKPFFHYLAFTAPHFPLHALPEDIQKYQGLYEKGWDEIRQRRWERIQRLKILGSGDVPMAMSQIEYDLGPPYHFPDALKKLGPGELNRPKRWSALTAVQKKFQSTKMAIHAAMIDRMDQEIGRVLEQLKEMNALKNTLILFLSDNGASAEIMVRTDGHDPSAPAGSGPSYLCLGPGWSTVANTPFRRHKTWVHEGGIRTPLIAHWPNKIRASESDRQLDSPHALRRLPGHVIDIVPTILQMAGADLSDTASVKLPGQSLLPVMANRSGKDQSDTDRFGAAKGSRTLWWSHEGNRALRKGKYKLVAAKGDPWSLYDLQSDPTEQSDLARQNPGQVEKLSQIWKQMQDSFIRGLQQNLR